MFRRVATSSAAIGSSKYGIACGTYVRIRKLTLRILSASTFLFGALSKVPRLGPLFLLATATCRWRWVWSVGGMILTGENWSARRETLYSVGGRWMNGYGALVEWYWQGKTEVLGEKHYIAWVVGEWMGMECWWNGTDRGKQKYWERNII